MNKINSLKILYISLFIIIMQSCSISDIYKSARIIKKIEFDNNLDKYYFDYRNVVVDSLIKKNKFKNYVLQESIDFDDVAGVKVFIFNLYTPDSSYSFVYKNIYGNEYKKRLKHVNNNCFYLTFNNDSIHINTLNNMNCLDFEKDKMYPVTHYFTNYKSNKLDQMVSIKKMKDILVYKKKNSKMIIDLNKFVWKRKTGELCVDNRNIDRVQCGDTKYINCLRNKAGFIIYCDSLQ